DTFAVERKTLSYRNRLEPAVNVASRDQNPRIVDLVTEQRGVVMEPEAPRQLLRHRGEQLRRGDPACNQGRDASKCGLVVSEHTDLVTACLDLPAALVRRDGAQSCHAGKGGGGQRDNKKDRDGHPVLGVG